MLDLRALEKRTEPGTLALGVCGKIQDHRDALRQQGADMWCEGTSQPGRASVEIRYIDDLSRVKGIQEFILHQKNRVFPQGQSSREVDLPAAILPHRKNNFALVSMLRAPANAAEDGKP